MGSRQKKRQEATPVAQVFDPKRIFEFLERRRRVLVVALILLATARIVSTYTVFNHTFDEPAHIACGMQWLDKGVYRWEPQHPPLSRVAMALGPYLAGIRSQNTPNTDTTAKYREGTAILYSGHHYDRTLALARMGNLPFFWLACAVVYLWARRYFGAPTGVIALALFTFLPLVLAHAGLATTDMALTAFVGSSFYSGLVWLERPGWKTSLVFGACTGLAILSKFSVFVFLPAAAAGTLIYYLAVERPAMPVLWKAVRERAGTFALAVLVACVVIWAGYRFSFDKYPAPELFQGIKAVELHNAEGHPMYLLGERSKTGFWYFFPVVFSVKTPIGYLILLAVGAWTALRSRTKAWIPFAFGAAIFLSALFSQINIGLRHILPVFIAFSIVAAAGVVRLMEGAGVRRWIVIGLGAAFVWMAASSALSHPDYLAYFNEFAGSEPEKIVVDSDLDWGQDVKRLAARLKEVGATEVTFSTMLVADLEREHGFPHLIPDMDATRPNAGWTAISLTLLKTRRLGLMDAYPNLQLWPDRIAPREKVGKGILLYYFPPR